MGDVWPRYCCVVLVRPAAPGPAPGTTATHESTAAPAHAEAEETAAVSLARLDQRIPEVYCEVRPATAAVKPGSIVCFGGKRELPDETPQACIARECEEELGWIPENVAASRVCELYVDGKLIAWFFRAIGPTDATPLKFEPGVVGRWVWPVKEPNMSGWHLAVLRAIYIDKTDRVDITLQVAH
eukprot:m.183802 g.183802  ORF g.183802 m.183802 type:complete len:184 (-) comp24672_c0_seq3:1783-2334(-)